MDFVEAIELRTKTGSSQNLDGFTNMVLVTPNDDADFEKYMAHFHRHQPHEISDGTARLFCTNNDYTARIFRIKGSNIFSEDLKESV